MLIRPRLLLASVLLVVGIAQAAPLTYKLDANHTMVLATWSHFGYSHPVASFGQVDGTLVYDADNVAASSVQVTLPLTGLDALVPDLTEHLRSADFFDAEKFPNATFKSTKVEAAGEGKLKVTGDLTIRDVTKPVVLDVTLNKAGEGRNGQPKIGFDATTTIKRSEFGVAKFIPNVSDEIALRISTEALVPKADDAAKADAAKAETKK
jgi:polyisoprenoid-binding protein YceI